MSPDKFEVQDCDAPVMFYHKGESAHPDYDRRSFRRKAPPAIERKVIAWDMEGISLSGQDRPQHAVLWGCSAELDKRLTIQSDNERLTSRAMLEYIVDVGARFPHAVHVGYGFRYDANMLIAGLGFEHVKRLWETGRTKFRFDDAHVWSIRWVPGKMFTVTKRWGFRRNTRAKVSVTIYDFASFFGQKFIDTCEQILGSDLSDSDREVISHGKAARGHQTWEGMSDIRHYWEREIVLMQRVFEKFRKVMHDAGFALKEWYGPGALANYINSTRGIRPKLAGVQQPRYTGENVVADGDVALPDGPHAASKIAFTGGRFELFRAGRISGPIFSVDINSAYPFALTRLPSFEMGVWKHRSNPSSIRRFGIYRISYRTPVPRVFEFEPQPLFWRDHRGMISYPSMTHGWYYSPEAAMVKGMAGVEIHEGWEWENTPGEDGADERPWAFLAEMYETRMRLGKKKLLSMPFKLGPNSLYGKYAQTVGWDQKNGLPPKSHALPVAGWVTSYCRAMLWQVIRQSPSTVIGVETDSVFMTRDPRELDIKIGDALGEWSVSEYDEMLYMQSGMYHTRKGEQWQGVKSRGITAREYPYASASEYLASLVGGEEWSPLTLKTKPRFIGAGAALASSQPFEENFTSWRSQTKEIAIGDSGKRLHNPTVCITCANGESPNVASHRMFVHSRSDGQTMSYPRGLPWEKTGLTPEVLTMRRELDIEADITEEK